MARRLEGASWWARALRAVRGMFVENLATKLVSCLLALGLWAWVQGELVVEETAWIGVDYKISDDKALTQEPNQRLRANISGPQALVRELRRVQPKLHVDLSEYPLGVHTIDFLPSEIEGLPPSVNVLGLAPNSLQVEVEAKHTRTVSVRVEQRGEPPEGYRVRQITVEPAEVEVQGPRSIVENIEAIVTEEISVSDLRATARVPVVLRLSPRTLGLSRSQPVTATIEIEPVTSARTFTDVPVIVRNRGWRSELESVEITLTGPMQALAAIGEDEVTVLVHVPDDVEGDSLMLSLGAESGARLEVLHPAADEVTVKKLSPSKLRVLGSGPPG
ncbi:MAG: YbbR-like domain-containing protein [Deltaproteobacteria bacterium]|nr:YbbR-like domain-containing protein [Deltaproteobacteria bacterium]